MRTGVLLLLCGVAWVGFASVLGGPAWVLGWLGLCLAYVGSVYLGLGGGPRMLGKRADGTLSWPVVVLLLPYFLLTWTVWHVQRFVSRERRFDTVVPGLLLGRRPLAHEVPPGVARVVDLTAEFPAPRGIRSQEGYRCVPMLDAFVPAESTLTELVTDILATPGTVFVHCAQGHGRSAMVVAAVLLARGVCAEPSDAEEHVRRVRPGARLHPEQRAFLTRMAPKLRALGTRIDAHAR